MEKEMVQKLEWLEAQNIDISADLFAAAKQQLQFLGVIDRNKWLYNGPLLERAIYRYNAYWLPLLAKYYESSSICEGPLVPPIDCEWVWHCHRLNPVRYRSDCEQFYGTVLGNSGIVSSTSGSCKLQTENLWKRLYPMEPYDLDVDMTISEPEDISALEKCTTYDLVSAVKRQSTFYNEVLSAHVDNDIILQEAVVRYKAFLYLLKRNHEKSIKLISVPTYDIDLIWHTHQLNPSSYYKDLEKIFGNILQHDDTDSDNSPGEKLDTIFSGTTAQWEETFGQRYWKASPDMTTVVVAAEKGGAGSKCIVMTAEKSDAGAKCIVMAADKCGAGAKCIVIAADKCGAGAKCIVIADEKCGAGAKCIVMAAEKSGAGAKCDVMVAEKSGVGAKCDVMVAEKCGTGAKCIVIAAEKCGAGAKCIVIADEKCGAGTKYDVMAAEKSGGGAKCIVIAAEKSDVGAKCAEMVAEKCGVGAKCIVMASGAGAKCIVTAAEKNNAKCRAVVAEKTSARCRAMVAKKNSAKFVVVTAENNSARCRAVVAEKNSARCRAVVAEKNSAKFRAMVAEKNSGKCRAVVAEKNNARYMAVASKKNHARYFAVAAEKDGGCGTMMKYNANENAPLAKALNGAAAASA